MSDNGIDSLVESVGRQVNDFAARIEEEEITDLADLNAFSKLCNTYNRLLESAGQTRVESKKEDNGFDIDAMSDIEFLDFYYAGMLDDWIEEYTEKGWGDPSHPRMLCIPDDVWMEWDARKPKLRIPILLHVPLD